MVEISKRCVNCITNLPIHLKELQNMDGIVFKAECLNKECSNPNYFVCKPCYEYSYTNLITARGRGKKSAYYNTIKSVKSHIKTSKLHNISLLNYCQPTETSEFDSAININDNNSTYSSTTDISSHMSNNENQADYKSFDLNTNSIKYYKYEHKFPGHGPKYLIGNAFHKREEDYEKISKEEVEFVLQLSPLLAQLPQKLLPADIVLVASNSKDKPLSIFG